MKSSKIRGSLSIFALLIAFALVLSACAAPVAAPADAPASDGSAAEAGGGTIVVGIPAGFDRLDPNVTTFSRVGNMTMHMTDPLVWQSEPGVYVPGSAKPTAARE